MTKEQELFFNKISISNKKEVNDAANNILKNFGQTNAEEISEISDIAKMIVETQAVEEESMNWIKPNMAVLDMSSQQIIDLLYDKIFSLDDDDCAVINEIELQKMEDSGYYNDDGADIEVITIPYEEKIKKSTKIPVFIKSDEMFKTEIERYLQSISKNSQENKQYIRSNVSIGINLLVRNYRRFLCENSIYTEAYAQKKAYEASDKIINNFCKENNVSRETIIDDTLYYPFSMQVGIKEKYTVEEVHKLMPYLYKNERFLVDDTEDRKPETVVKIKIDDLLSQILGIRKYQYKLKHTTINAPSREFYEYTNKVAAYDATYNAWFDTNVLPFIHVKSSAEENISSLSSILVSLGAQVIENNTNNIEPEYESIEKSKILQDLERKRVREQLNYGVKKIEVCGKNFKIPYRLWGFVPEIFAPEETLTFDLEVPYYTWEIRENLSKTEIEEYEKLLLEKAKLTYRLLQERENYFKVLHSEKLAKEQQQKKTLSAYNRTHNKTLSQLNEDIREREINKYGHELTKEERTLIYNADDLDTQEKINRKKVEFTRLQKLFNEIGEAVPDLEIKKSVNMILFGQETVPYRNFSGFSVPVQRMTSEELYESRDLTAYFESNFVVDEDSEDIEDAE